MAASGSKHGLVRGLIGFHGNFIYDDTYNVLLEYADKGTLEDYFMSIPPPTSEDDIVSFWRGLFSPIFALLNIHTLEDQDFDNPSIFQGYVLFSQYEWGVTHTVHTAGIRISSQRIFSSSATPGLPHTNTNSSLQTSGSATSKDRNPQTGK